MKQLIDTDLGGRHLHRLETGSGPDLADSGAVGCMALGPLYLADKRALARLQHPPVAELNSLAIINYDADYDRIADITSQPESCVAPRGSI